MTTPYGQRSPLIDCDLANLLPRGWSLRKRPHPNVGESALYATKGVLVDLIQDGAATHHLGVIFENRGSRNSKTLDVYIPLFNIDKVESIEKQLSVGPMQRGGKKDLQNTVWSVGAGEIYSGWDLKVGAADGILGTFKDQEDTYLWSISRDFSKVEDFDCRMQAISQSQSEILLPAVKKRDAASTEVSGTEAKCPEGKRPRL